MDHSPLEFEVITLRAENAALKEQVATKPLYYSYEDVVIMQRDLTGRILDTENTIAQQAAVIEQMRDVFNAASMDTETINRKAPEIAKDCCSIPMPDTYGMYHLTDEEVCNVVGCYLYWLHKNQPINLQPSPEILQARDERVAEACAKTYEQAFYTNKAEAIRSGEWRKYL